MNIKTISIEKDDMLIINGALTLSMVKGSSALPIINGDAIRISGMLDNHPHGYSGGNSGYRFRKYRNDMVYVQPGYVIPHESQLPRSYLVAMGAMFWRTSYPISHPNKVYEEEENSNFFEHGEIIYNKDEGEIIFPRIDEDVRNIWRTVSFPLLQKQLKEIEISEGD